jgi:hypothetical protein
MKAVWGSINLYKILYWWVGVSKKIKKPRKLEKK